MTARPAFSLRFYLATLAGLLANPRTVFSELSPEEGWRRPTGFLGVSALLFAGASLMSQPASHPVRMGLIFFANGVGMTVIAAGVGWLIIVLMLGRPVAFRRIFHIYALAAGITLLASWIPSFLLITEPWKWWLVGTGMTRALGLSRKTALIAVGLSVAIIVLFFWSLLPLLRAMR